MIVTKSDLREYIREDQRMQPWPSNPLKRIIGAGGAIVRWKVYLRKCEYHHNVSQDLYHKLAYVWYLFFLKKYERRFCSEIPINVFGKGLLIWHPERIIVNPESTSAIIALCPAALSLRRRTVDVRPWVTMWNS